MVAGIVSGWQGQGGKDEGQVPRVRIPAPLGLGLLSQVREEGVLDASLTRYPTVDRLARARGDGDIRVAGDELVVEEKGIRGQGNINNEPLGGGILTTAIQATPGAPPAEGGVALHAPDTPRGVPETSGARIARATEYWGVEWAALALAQTEWCESRGRDWVVGASGELGRFQFLVSTWATTPYAAHSPQNPEAATFAAAWMVSVGRQYEFTCWPR